MRAYIVVQYLDELDSEALEKTTLSLTEAVLDIPSRTYFEYIERSLLTFYRKLGFAMCICYGRKTLH